MTIKTRLPRIMALETGPLDEGGLYNRLEYECGCITVRRTMPRAPAVWTYLERCDDHKGEGTRFAMLVEPDPDDMPDYWGR